MNLFRFICPFVSFAISFFNMPKRKLYDDPPNESQNRIQTLPSALLRHIVSFVVYCEKFDEYRTNCNALYATFHLICKSWQIFSDLFILEVGEDISIHDICHQTHLNPLGLVLHHSFGECCLKQMEAMTNLTILRIPVETLVWRNLSCFAQLKQLYLRNTQHNRAVDKWPFSFTKAHHSTSSHYITPHSISFSN